MSAYFACPTCPYEFHTQDRYVGLRHKCPVCGQWSFFVRGQTFAGAIWKGFATPFAWMAWFAGNVIGGLLSVMGPVLRMVAQMTLGVIVAVCCLFLCWVTPILFVPLFAIVICVVLLRSLSERQTP